MIKTVRVIVSNPFQENIDRIVLIRITGECIIVDAGGYTPQENAALSKYIEQNGLRPSWPSIRTVMWTICSA